MNCTVEQCHAVNNIEFVLQSIRPFVDELKINDILSKIEELNGGLVADACRKTVKVLVENAIENVENQIINVSTDIILKQLNKINNNLIGNNLLAAKLSIFNDKIELADLNLSIKVRYKTILLT